VREPIFVYLVDSLGFRALFRPSDIVYEDARTIVVDGVRVRVPARATLEDTRGADTLRIVLDIEDAVGSDVRRDRRGPGARVERAKPYFIQMMGTATISGRLNGVPLTGSGTGFFETYR
jgi:hypothetical protein